MARIDRRNGKGPGDGPEVAKNMVRGPDGGSMAFDLLSRRLSGRTGSRTGAAIWPGAVNARTEGWSGSVVSAWDPA